MFVMSSSTDARDVFVDGLRVEIEALCVVFV